MATVYWEPKVEAVAQVASGSIDSVDATPSNNTFTVTIGGVAISQAGDTDVGTTAAALVVLLNNSAHPYFAAVTWANPSGGTITGTADVAGAPFTAALTETGAGTGTVTDFSDTTANASPHDVGDTGNYSGGALPTGVDDFVIPEGSVSLLYNLEAVTDAATITVMYSFTGNIGLEESGFATSLDGETRDATVPEYRTGYLRIDVDDIIIGRDDGNGGTGLGSARVKIHNDKAGASLLRVENTASTVSGNKPAVRYKADNASADVEVLSAPGGVGIAIDVPGETSTVGDVTVVDQSTGSRVSLGPGVTLTNFEQQGGQNVLNAAADISGSVKVHGGTLDIIGDDYNIATLTIDGGEVNDRHIDTTGADWTTVTVSDNGRLVLTGTQESRTVTTLNINAGGTVEAAWGDLTVTTYNKPSEDLASVTVAAL